MSEALCSLHVHLVREIRENLEVFFMGKMVPQSTQIGYNVHSHSFIPFHTYLPTCMYGIVVIFGSRSFRVGSRL